jgi:hypothetical protein
MGVGRKSRGTENESEEGTSKMQQEEVGFVTFILKE